jgi:small-conductance mechanosensitive channel
MHDPMTALLHVLDSPKLTSGLRALTVFAISLFLARLLGGFTSSVLARASAQHRMLGRRIAFYSLLSLGAVSALRELGFELNALLGAAGVMTVALGFAAQTSTSNFIAGLFLIGERPFVLGDVIRIGDTTGEVLSIDLLSVKLRTFDNLFVRVPNETVVKSQVTNLTHFPIRRLDLTINVPYSADLSRVRELLMSVAHDNPLALDEPKPLLIIQGFGDSAVKVQLSTWAASDNYVALKNQVHEAIKRGFERAGIELPSAPKAMRIEAPAEPLPVTIVSDARGDGDE